MYLCILIKILHNIICSHVVVNLVMLCHLNRVESSNLHVYVYLPVYYRFIYFDILSISSYIEVAHQTRVAGRCHFWTKGRKTRYTSMEADEHKSNGQYSVTSSRTVVLLSSCMEKG